MSCRRTYRILRPNYIKLERDTCHRSLLLRFYVPQVEAALTNDPTNDELLKLKDDLAVSGTCHATTVILGLCFVGSDPTIKRFVAAGSRGRCGLIVSNSSPVDMSCV